MALYANQTKKEERGDAKLMKIMHHQFLKAIKDVNEYIKFYMCEDDPQTWYILLSNLSGDKNEFEGGEYIFRMWANAKFPFEPPRFTALTPNGVYDIEKVVCISIGQYHSDKYQSVLGMQGFANELANGIVCWRGLGHGISIIATETSHKQKVGFAKSSRAYNEKNYPDIMHAINSAFENYSSKWDVSKMERRLALKLGLVDEEEEADPQSDPPAPTPPPTQPDIPVS